MTGTSKLHPIELHKLPFLFPVDPSRGSKLYIWESFIQDLTNQTKITILYRKDWLDDLSSTIYVITTRVCHNDAKAKHKVYEGFKKSGLGLNIMHPTAPHMKMKNRDHLSRLLPAACDSATVIKCGAMVRDSAWLVSY